MGAVMRPSSFAAVYNLALGELTRPGTPVETNERTGTRVRVIRGGMAFKLDLSSGLLPTPGTRRVYPATAAAELAWFLSGERDVTWLRGHAPIWNGFTEDDGVTVANAYGHRWRRHFGRDQVREAVRALTEDPSDRRVYVGAWDPGADGMGRPSKNVPCPVGFSVNAVAREVHVCVTLRSLDVFVGLPYDVMDFSLLCDAFAAELALGPGTLTVAAAHAHLYEPHWDMARRCLEEQVVTPPVRMPHWRVSSIAPGRDRYVAAVRRAAVETGPWPGYAPRPEVVL